MNRRQFLAGLLASTAAPALPDLSLAKPLIQRTGLPTVTWRLLHQGVPIKEVHTLIYGTDEAPMRFTAHKILGGICDDE